MKLTGKILALVIPVVLGSLIVLMLLTTQTASKSLTNSYAEKLVAVVGKTKSALKRYFEGIDNFLYIDSTRRLFVDSLKKLQKIYERIDKETGGKAEEVLQKAYIDDNPYPPGEKYKLISPKGDVDVISMIQYNINHRKIHPVMKNIVDKMGFYDIFLVTPKGNVVYTYYKKRDFATNLDHGRWRDTNLAKLYRILKNSKDNEAHFVDFEPYAPSRGIPAAFAGVPVRDSYKKMVGYLIIQLPIDKINKILQEKTGMGKTGETYAVGPDYLMRSDSRFAKGSTILKQKVESESVRRALEGESGWMKIIDYRGVPALSAYMPFVFKELKWAIIGEVDYSEATAGVKKLFSFSLITLVVVAIVSVIVVIIFTRRLIKPIKDLGNLIMKVADGDLTVKFPVKGKDEIAQMADSLNHMMKSLRETVKNIKDASLSINDAADDLAAISEEQSASFEELASQAENVKNRVEDVTEYVEQVNSGIEEVAAGAQNVSRAVQEMSDDASDAVRLAQDGMKAIEEVVSDIERVVEETGKTAEVVQDLTRRVQNIGEIVETINSIAEQTNLLALNAAIEAARAGEAGKGFAVVADEIRKLAEESRSATDKIAGMLKEIQDKTSTTNETVERMNESVEKSKEASEIASKQFENIMSRIEAIQSAAQNIAAIAEEQSAAAQEMSSAVDTMSKSVVDVSNQISSMTDSIHQQSEGAEQVATAAQNLSDLSRKLEDAIGRFKI